jgi:hypothetical protein
VTNDKAIRPLPKSPIRPMLGELAPMIGTDKCKFWWSAISKWDDRVEKELVQSIELVVRLSALIVLVFSLLAPTR